MFGKQTFAQLRTGFKHYVYFRLQALVYDILPSTTAVFPENCQLTSSFSLVVKQ